MFDVYENIIYLSYSDYQTNEPAYLRSPMKIDLKYFYGITGSLKPSDWLKYLIKIEIEKYYHI